MNHLEPNLLALSWFSFLWSVCCLGFLQLTGMYPLRAREAGVARKSAFLVLGNTALWLVLVAGTLFFAWTRLRWTTTVVVAGLLFLLVPGLFQTIPVRLHDGRGGLAIAACVLAAALGLLAWLSIAAMGGPQN